MKGCLIVLISRENHLVEIFDSNILSIIDDYRKVLIINNELKNLLTDIDYKCYDVVDFVNMKPANQFTSFYDVKDLERILKIHCQDFSPKKTYIFSADEFNLEIIAYVTTKLGVNGLRSDMANFFRDKLLMKKYLKENSEAKLPNCLLIDASYNHEKLSSILGKSFVVKPTAHAGAIGFRIIHNKNDWNSLINSEYFKQFEYEAETLLLGDVYEVDTVRIKHKNITTVIGKYVFPPSDSAGKSKPFGALLIKENDEAYDNIIELNNKVLDAFDLDGCFHLECIKLKDNPSFFLEVAWRQAGYPPLCAFKQIYGGYSQTLFEIFATLGHELPEKKISDYKELRLILPKKKGVFKGLNLTGFKSQCKEKLFVKIGEVMNTPISFFDTSAEISFINENYDELVQDFFRVRKVSLYK